MRQKKFLLLSMTHLVQLVPEFKTANDDQRQKLFLRLFSKAKYTISKNLLYIENTSVHLSNIFRANDGVRRSWQVIVKTKFVSLALKMFHTIILHGNTKKKEWSDCYDTHMVNLDLTRVHIGDENTVPTRAHRSVNGHNGALPDGQVADFIIIDNESVVGDDSDVDRSEANSELEVDE